jgi:uncharacterized protein
LIARVAFAAPPGSRVAVVADTHGHPHPRAAERLAALRPVAILHGGDIGDLRVLDDLAAIAPVHAVRGNIDGRARDLPDFLTVDAGPLRLLLTHIAVYGPRLRAEVAKRAKDEGAGLVVCGHSHVPFIGRDKGLPMFNPGSIGPRRFSLPIVFGTIEIGAEIRLVHWDCETGAPWSPPG